MDKITGLFAEHYARTFAAFGATPKGVDWNAEEDVRVRYAKMLDVMRKDFLPPGGAPSLLDVGCGWGGLYAYAKENGADVEYTGIELVQPMVDYAQQSFLEGKFICGDIFKTSFEHQFDFVVSSGILTLKVSATIPEMERFTKHLIHRMYSLCRHGIAFNMMSTRVNYMAPHLYYQNPAEMLSYCLSEVSPRVRLDHGYSSLGSGLRRLYEFTVYVYKD